MAISNHQRVTEFEPGNGSPTIFKNLSKTAWDFPFGAYDSQWELSVWSSRRIEHKHIYVYYACRNMHNMIHIFGLEDGRLYLHLANYIDIWYWLVVWNIFSIYWEFHTPNWLSYCFTRVGQPPTRSSKTIINIQKLNTHLKIHIFYIQTYNV